MDGITAGDVFGARQVAQLVQVTGALEALLQFVAACRAFGGFGRDVCEAAQDLLARAVAELEAGDELDKLALDLLG